MTVAKGSGKHSLSNSTNNICGPPAPLIFHAQSQNSLCISPCSLPRFHSYKQQKVRLRTCTIMQFFATFLPFASLRDLFESHNMQRNVLSTVRLAGFCRLCYYDKLSFKCVFTLTEFNLLFVAERLQFMILDFKQQPSSTV